MCGIESEERQGPWFVSLLVVSKKYWCCKIKYDRVKITRHVCRNGSLLVLVFLWQLLTIRRVSSLILHGLSVQGIKRSGSGFRLH